MIVTIKIVNPHFNNNSKVRINNPLRPVDLIKLIIVRAPHRVVKNIVQSLKMNKNVKN